jgi:hypothetical protein
MPHPDTHYPVPVLTDHSTSPPSGCRSIKITEVGGSFLAGLNEAFEKLVCPPEITDWFYWDNKHIHNAGGHLYDLPMDAAARRKSLLDADVVLFEENEAAGPGSKHGEKMMEEVAKLAGGDRSSDR